MIIRPTARATALALCLLAAGSVFAAPARKAAAPKLYTIEQFMATTALQRRVVQQG